MLRCTSVCLCLCLCVLGLVEAQYLDRFEGDVCKEENGRKWICTAMEDCPKFQEDRKKGIRPKTCAFVNKQPLICCEPPNKSKKMCKKYGESVFTTVVDPYTDTVDVVEACVIVEPLISGGKDAQPREYPHMALIGYGEERNKKWLCGGSLISERYILSAAHCTNAGIMGEARWARLGEYNIRSTKDDEDGNAQPQDHEIIQRINHPKYRSVIYNDIALYKLKDTVEFNEYIRPICLNTEHEFTNKPYAIATGWGKLEQSGPKGEVLQKVNLTYTTTAKCSKFFPAGTGDLVTGLDRETMICAGNFNNSGDTCGGDSGGPLQNRLVKPYCMYNQIGITSFGSGACGIHKPAVYTRVAHYVEWIESIVWP